MKSERYEELDQVSQKVKIITSRDDPRMKEQTRHSILQSVSTMQRVNLSI